MKITAADWQEALVSMGVRALTALDWRDAFEGEIQPQKFSKGMDDVLDLVPQLLHETGMLERLEENLNYSPQRLTKVWPSRFRTEALANAYAHQPEKLANLVYGGRMGNTQPGDGWRFRGRGPIMLTGRAGYEHVGRIMGQDLDVSPQLVLQKRFGLQAAVAWWEDRIPDGHLSDQVKIRRRVNGGAIGLEHCQQLADSCRKAFA